MHSDGKNRKTLYLIVGTMAIAALALGLLMQFGKAKNTISNANPTGRLNGSESLPLPKKDLIPDSVSRSTGISAPNLLAGELSATPMGTAKGFDYESPNDEGKLALRVRGGTTEPLPNGLIRIPDPQAWVYPTDDRLVYITADEAEIEGTELDPQAGTLIGNVRIRIFAQDQSSSTSDIRNLDIESSTVAPIAEMTAERVHFDRATNQISTADHFVIRTDQLAAAGRGLNAVYNEIDNRIEHLRIEQRESIVFSTAKSSSSAKPTDNTTAIHETPGAPNNTGIPIITANNVAKHSESVSIPVAEGLSEGPVVEPGTDALPYYRIVLSQGVTIVQLSNGESVSASGDTFSAELSLDSSDTSTLFSLHSDDSKNHVIAINTNALHQRHSSPLSQTNSRPMVSVTHPFRSSTVARAGIVLVAAAVSFAQTSTNTVADPPRTLSEVDLANLPLPLGMSYSESTINKQLVVVLGSGPLEIVPLLEQPDHLVGRDDIFGTITGSPVTLQSKDGSAECARVEYRKSAETTTLFANNDNPVIVHLVDDAIAKTNSPVELNTNQNTVRFLGAGTFNSGDDTTQNNHADPATHNRSAPGRIDFAGGVSAQWSDSVTLTFDGVQAGQSINTKDEDANGSLGKIKSAEFRGKVRFEHSGGYTLEADQLVAHFDDYHGILEEPAISLITGTGHVRVYSREGEVSGDQLDVTFALDQPLGKNQDPQPTVIEFSNHITATDSRNTLRADYLRIDFYKPSELALIRDTTGDDNRVRRVVATNHVTFDLEGGGKAVGDRLTVNQREGTATLTGKNVIVSKDTMRIVAPQIDLDRKLKTVHIVGAGVMTYLDLGNNTQQNGASGGNRRLRDSEDVWQEIRRRLDRPQNQDNKQENNSRSDNSQEQNNNANNNTITSNINNSGQAVRIRWQKEMIFNDDTGHGEFVGSVLAETAAKPDEYNSIQADRLIFRLTQPIKSPAVVSADRAGSPIITGGTNIQNIPSPSDLGLLSDRSGQGGRRLIEMTATSESNTPAKIQAVRYTDAERKTPISIFYVAGPIIEYFNATKRLTVTGTGSMFLYDGRPEPTTPAISANNNDDTNSYSRNESQSNTTTRDSKISFSGKGRTLFKWTGSLMLDGIKQSMTILDDVSIRHRSLTSDEAKSAGALDMWCQSLRSAMDTGADDIDVLSMSGQATGKLKMLDATGSIYIVSESREISASHLHFESATQLAVLAGSADAPVTVTKAGSPNSFEAERVFWDLYADSITVEHPGATTMPTGGP